MIKFYCELCDCHRPVDIESLQTDDLNKGKPPWGDIVCAECHLVIATISASESGVYQFEKIAEVPSFDDDSIMRSYRWKVAEMPPFDDAPITRSCPWTAIGFSFLVSSLIAVIGTRIHHLTINPHLTEAEALTFYLPMWIGAIIMAVVGYVVVKRSK